MLYLSAYLVVAKFHKAYPTDLTTAQLTVHDDVGYAESVDATNRQDRQTVWWGSCSVVLGECSECKKLGRIQMSQRVLPRTSDHTYTRQ